MIYRKLDSDGDYTFGGNKQDFLAEVEAVRQAIMTRLKLLKEEWWEDIEDGLPLFQSILGQPNLEQNIRAIDLIVQDRIINTKGVREVFDYESSYDKRTYSASCKVITIYGETELEVRL